MMQAMASKSELPQGYFPCEYIESDGTNFIDTGLLGKSGLQVKCKCSFNDVTSVHNVFGVLEGANRLFIQYDNAEGLLYAYGAWNDTNASISSNEVYEMDATFNIGSQSFKLDGNELYSGTSSTNISTSLNAYLFALNLNGTPNFQAKMRLYYCKIYDNGTLVRDYIPCVNPEGYFGLYDDVTCEFYGFVKEGAGEVGTYSVNRGYWGTRSMSSLDSKLYDGVYYSSGTEWDTEVLRITVKGCSTFTCYIRSWAESGMDYVMISKLDKAITSSTRDGDAEVMASTRYSNNVSGTALSNYKKVTYTNIDKGTHTIDVGYRKDGTDDMYDDEGYLIIEKPIAEKGGTANVVGRGKVILPSSYVNAEYIEGDGNAWVDSGYFPNGNTKVVMDAQMNSYSSGFPAFFGAFGTSNKNSFAFLDPASASNYYAYYYGSSSTASNGITTGMFDRGLIIADKGTVDYHGVIVSLADASFTSTNTLYLFCGNENGTLKYKASMRLYQCQIHDNGVFTKFFIPCMKDGVFGFFEMFEKVFYSSEGSSEFSGQLNQ
jgi:hypothetical protein